MTREQFARWQDFAVRLAGLESRRRNPSGAWVVEAVRAFLSDIDEEKASRIRGWDDCDDDPALADLPRWQRIEYGPGDMFTEWSGDYVTSTLGMPRALRRRFDAAVTRGDYDAVDNIRWDWVDSCADLVSAPLRAALDCVMHDGPGVLGYTAGDLRRCYPSGVPDWITGGPDHHWYEGTMNPVLNGTFASFPDSAELVL
jgi:hypothetical protein